jgi:hypothetical protein
MPLQQTLARDLHVPVEAISVCYNNLFRQNLCAIAGKTEHPELGGVIELNSFSRAFLAAIAGPIPQARPP